MRALVRVVMANVGMTARTSTVFGRGPRVARTRPVPTRREGDWMPDGDLVPSVFRASALRRDQSRSGEAGS